VLGPVDAEECDEGGNNGDDKSCTSACKNNVCGDGLVGPGEACDDANMNDMDDCTNACKVAKICGDGIVAATEECDDGNMVDEDACTNNCTAAKCGDQFIQPVNGETCDNGPQNSDNGDCTSSCLEGLCGDGLLHNIGAGLEECDNGPDNGPGQSCLPAASSTSLRRRRPGPGRGLRRRQPHARRRLQPDLQARGLRQQHRRPGEQCDDGKNGNNADTCTDAAPSPPAATATCSSTSASSATPARTTATTAPAPSTARRQVRRRPAVGRQGAVRRRRQQRQHQGLHRQLHLQVCGDGFVGPGEACDDGNKIDNDMCTNACKPPAVRRRHRPGRRAVRPRRNNSNTGTCTLACLNAKPAATASSRSAGEECDDGNASNTDACVARPARTPSAATPSCAPASSSATTATSSATTAATPTAPSPSSSSSPAPPTNGNLGGLGGGDGKCQTLANAAKLGGTFKAWISNNNLNPQNRFVHSSHRLRPRRRQGHRQDLGRPGRRQHPRCRSTSTRRRPPSARRRVDRHLEQWHLARGGLLRVVRPATAASSSSATRAATTRPTATGPTPASSTARSARPSSACIASSSSGATRVQGLAARPALVKTG
jgi:cysteine-rich repeat protein